MRWGSAGSTATDWAPLPSSISLVFVDGAALPAQSRRGTAAPRVAKSVNARIRRSPRCMSIEGSLLATSRDSGQRGPLILRPRRGRRTMPRLHTCLVDAVPDGRAVVSGHKEHVDVRA